jgi:hypothetical protein
LKDGLGGGCLLRGEIAGAGLLRDGLVVGCRLRDGGLRLGRGYRYLDGEIRPFFEPCRSLVSLRDGRIFLSWVWRVRALTSRSLVSFPRLVERAILSSDGPSHHLMVHKPVASKTDTVGFHRERTALLYTTARHLVPPVDKNSYTLVDLEHQHSTPKTNRKDGEGGGDLEFPGRLLWLGRTIE